MTRIDRLKARLERLEDKLFEAREKENEQYNSIGFGAGMRRSHISNTSFMRTTRLQQQIEQVKEQIKQIQL